MTPGHPVEGEARQDERGIAEREAFSRATSEAAEKFDERDDEMSWVWLCAKLFFAVPVERGEARERHEITINRSDSNDAVLCSCGWKSAGHLTPFAAQEAGKTHRERAAMRVGLAALAEAAVPVDREHGRIDEVVLSREEFEQIRRAHGLDKPIATKVRREITLERLIEKADAVAARGTWASPARAAELRAMKDGQEHESEAHPMRAHDEVERLREALELIASCDAVVDRDVVSIARGALAQVDPESHDEVERLTRQRDEAELKRRDFHGELWEDRAQKAEATVERLRIELGKKEIAHELQRDAADDAEREVERLRTKAREVVDACLPLLPLQGSDDGGYMLSAHIDARVSALPDEWASAAQAVADLRAALAATQGEGK
jgi:hypothetical protein